jgi:hypothetical protein
VSWDHVALTECPPYGEVLVIDEMADVAAPLTAVKLKAPSYEATLEGHRAARKLSGARLRWTGPETARSSLEYSRF